MAEYPPVATLAVEPYYSRHVAAMTAEELHSKADIARQLAWRDQRIAALKDNFDAALAERDRLAAERDRLRDRVERLAAEADRAARDAVGIAADLVRCVGPDDLPRKWSDLIDREPVVELALRLRRVADALDAARKAP